MTLPIPDSLIQTTMLLTSITFMYLAAKAVTDTQYRAQFLDPILYDLRLTLVALGRYRSMTIGQAGSQAVQPISTRERPDD
jgi:hypothetical protein